ncbi:MAG: hypothetical protein NC926_10355, partial [Candidatus Omnitrophica bacterium]|nr:hypothetical protein [Candidatus Omnitrophota bacterium]
SFHLQAQSPLKRVIFSNVLNLNGSKRKKNKAQSPLKRVIFSNRDFSKTKNINNFTPINRKTLFFNPKINITYLYNFVKIIDSQ